MKQSLLQKFKETPSPFFKVLIGLLIVLVIITIVKLGYSFGQSLR